MSSLKWIFPFIFLSITNLVFLVKSQFPTPIFFHYECLNTGNYTSNSTYKTNLDTLLFSVSSNIDPNNGFYNASVGENLDRVNAIALCRADLQPYQCRNYIENATSMILKFCPYQKEAILWHEFCMIRYSNVSILGTVAYSPYKAGFSVESVPNEEKFYKELKILLDSLQGQAAYSNGPKKFAADRRADPDYRTIYAFEQCTPDISPEDCVTCLTESAQIIPDCCGGARGVRVLRPSCYLRFETDPFYNDTMVRMLEPWVPIAPVPQGKDKNKTRTILAITIPVGVCLILTALCIVIFLKVKQNRKQILVQDKAEINNVGTFYEQELGNRDETSVKILLKDSDYDGGRRVVDANYKKMLAKKIKEECMRECKEMYFQQMKSFEDQLNILNSQIHLLQAQLASKDHPQ